MFKGKSQKHAHVQVYTCINIDAQMRFMTYLVLEITKLIKHKLSLNKMWEHNITGEPKELLQLN